MIKTLIRIGRTELEYLTIVNGMPKNVLAVPALFKILGYIRMPASTAARGSLVFSFLAAVTASRNGRK